jgi:hypothetical protein
MHASDHLIIWLRWDSRRYGGGTTINAEPQSTQRKKSTAEEGRI